MSLKSTTGLNQEIPPTSPTTSSLRGTRSAKRNSSILSLFTNSSTDKDSERIEEPSIPIRNSIVKLKVRLTISQLLVRSLPAKYNGKRLECSWKRGSKKDSNGKFDKLLIENGSVVWSQPIELLCTFKLNLKNQKYSEKSIVFSFKYSDVRFILFFHLID